MGVLHVSNIVLGIALYLDEDSRLRVNPLCPSHLARGLSALNSKPHRLWQCELCVAKAQGFQGSISIDSTHKAPLSLFTPSPLILWRGGHLFPVADV